MVLDHRLKHKNRTISTSPGAWKRCKPAEILTIVIIIVIIIVVVVVVIVVVVIIVILPRY